VITGSSKLIPNPTIIFVKNPIYSPILGVTVTIVLPKFTRNSNPNGTTT
jgi:hypothetical protein